jgi:radical SAM family uncharacterized protein
LETHRNCLVNRINEILPLVQKPGRYVGGEFNQVVKEWGNIETHTALVFPDTYEIGLPNLGMTILYEIINGRVDSLAERVYCPWSDMEKLMRENNLPIFSLESFHPLGDFDIVGISIPYESLYTNVLNILDLAKIPLLSCDREIDHPLIIAGGNSTFNPEPMHQFIDAFVIGEGEKIIHSIIEVYQDWKKSSNARLNLLERLSRLEGVYVPFYYKVEYFPDNLIKTFQPIKDEIPQKIKRQMVFPLLPAPLKFLVPNIDTTHNRVAIEIMRGCTRGCRFCQAGMINRPIRERPVDEIVDSIKTALKNTGFEEITLLSLSSSDYTQISKLINEISKEFCDRNISISLPSLRIDSFSVEHMDILEGKRHGSFTFAPEAASDNLRNRINKPISSNQLISVVREVFRHGWPTIKLYFMIGFPGETIEDVESICELSREVLAVGIQEIGKRASINLSVNTFIPKPHTPFQWVAQEKTGSLNVKQDYLKKHLKDRGIKLNWSDNDSALLEACLSRGDRRLSNVILDAWKNGAKFDAWHDHFNWSAWQQAFEKNKIDPGFFVYRERNLDEIFPWDHIDIGIRKTALMEEFELSQHEMIRPDCREQCYGCGIQASYQFTCLTNQADIEFN